jgi:hypothetical protein
MMNMPDKLVTFVFSVVCAETDDLACAFPTGDPQLDDFKKVMGKIRDKLGDPNRPGGDGEDTKLLVLKGLDVYAGPLEPGQSHGELTTGKRYGRIIITGMAAGKNIFTNPAPSFDEMKEYEKRFNFLLNEIFSCEVEGQPPYIPIPNLQKYHPDEPNPPTEVHWNAAWTIFVVPEGTDFRVMGGHNC